MKKLDAFEKDLLTAHDKGELKSTSPSKAKLAKFKAAATATFLKEKRINIVSGRLVESPSSLAKKVRS